MEEISYFKNMISTPFKFCDKILPKTEMKIGKSFNIIKKDKPIIVEENNNEPSKSPSKSPSNLKDYCPPKSPTNETNYLGVLHKHELQEKTGNGHFYLYHLNDNEYNDTSDLNNLGYTLKLHAFIKLSPIIGMHIPIIKKSGYTVNCRQMEGYYSLGPINSDKKKFENINKLIEYYKNVPPSQIVKENKKIVKVDKIYGTEYGKSSTNSSPSSVSSYSTISDTQRHTVKEDDNDIKDIQLKKCNEMEKSTNNTSSQSTDTVTFSSNNSHIKRLQKSNKRSNDKIKSISKSTSIKSSDPLTEFLDEFNIPTEEDDKDFKKNSNFYKNYYLGEMDKKEIRNIIRKPFHFAFYLRKSSTNRKEKKKKLYLVYKPIEGNVIHLPVIKKKVSQNDNFKISTKKCYIVQTPCGSNNIFNNFKEMVDYYYDRIKKVKQLYELVFS